MNTVYSVEAARRQRFGAMFEHTARDEAVVEQLLLGNLTLRPHPSWMLAEAIDWTADPFVDRNWMSQYHMLRWLDPLRRRAESGDDRAADMWLRYARDWVRTNPSDAPAWEGAWGDMVDGIRALALCVAVPFVAERDPAALSWLIASIEEHAAWLRDEDNLGHSNHALHQHQGLLVCSAVLRDVAGIGLAAQRLESLFESQYDDQGINAEGALAYHLANFKWWSVARQRLEAEDIAVPSNLQLLDLVPLELAHATKPDGLLVSIGDTDGLAVRGIDHPATRWVSSAGADGRAPDDLIRLYDAGYLYVRSGWGEQERRFRDETFLSVSFGAANRVHGHRDGASVTFSSMGHEWITDPGKFQYGTSAMRDYCLQRDSHSLVTVPGRAYDRSSVVRCTKHHESDATYDVTFEDRGYEGVTLTRRIVYSVAGEYAVVIDSVAADDECTAVQNWQTGRGTVAEMRARGFALEADAGRAAVLFGGTQPEMDMSLAQDDPISGWVATGWKTREPAPTLRFAKTGTRFRFVTLLAAGFRGAEPTMQMVKHDTKGELRIRVDTGRVAEELAIAAASSRVVSALDDVDADTEDIDVATGPEFDPGDTAARARLFSTMRQARRDAWGSTPLERRAIADDLRALRATMGVRGSVDLGLEATVNDLLGTTFGDAGPREVVKHRSGLVDWNQQTERFVPDITAPIVSLSEAGDLPTLDGDRLLTLTLGPLLVPAYVAPDPGDTLTVLFHGAVDRARTRLPFFQRIRFQRSLGAGPTVAFSDPTLDLSRELRLGWYLGTEEIDMPSAIAAAIQRLADALGAGRIVLQGGSGGGFAALQVGAHLPGSHVVAISPQTDLSRYSYRFYRDAAVAAFGMQAPHLAPELLPRVHAVHRLEKLRPQLDVTLVMNSGDLLHQRDHAAPLREFYASHPNGDLTDVRFDLGPGHLPLSNEQYEGVMRDVYARAGGTRVDR